MKRIVILLMPLLSLVSGTLVAQTAKQKKPTIDERVINIDFNKTSGKLNRMFNECVGAGRANEGLRADWQQQLAYMANEKLHTDKGPLCKASCPA
jgi:xylan 1,4-beta-xylosidase